MIRVQVKQSIFIDLSAEKIFAYLSDLERLVDWSSVTKVIKKDASEAMQVGVTIQSTIRFLGSWRDIIFEVIEYEPCYALTLKSISGIAPCLFCYQLEPVAGGGTIVSQEAVIDLTEGNVEQAEQLITDAMRQQLKHDMLTLKNILEIRASLGIDSD